MIFPARMRLITVLLISLSFAAGVRADDWPQWRGPNRDAVWNETDVLQTFPPDGLTVRWRAPVGIGFSSPIVAHGRVYLTDSVLARPKATERVQAFDESTGKPLWTYDYDVNYPDPAFNEASLRGPIATPIAADGRVFSLGASGVLVCLDAFNGKMLWRKDLQQQYPKSPLQPGSSPLIEGDLLILLIGAKPAASVIAFDKRTGKEIWKSLDEGPTASSPIVITSGGARQLIIWSEQSVASLNPVTGKIYWRHQLFTTQDAAVSTPVYHDGRLLIGGLMMKLDPHKPAAVVLWPETRATARRVFSDTSTALFQDDFVYSARSLGAFICVEAATGRQLWETDKVTDSKNGASVHLTTNGRTALLYNDQGELIRANLTPDGYHEITRARVLDPAVTFSGRKTAWAAPAFANRHIFARTNKELVCASLAIGP